MNSNRDLQINHKVVRFLEEAKAQSEIILDRLPGLFAIIDANGVVYRGNRKLAEYLNVEFEFLAGNIFDRLLEIEHRSDFSIKLMSSLDFLEPGIDFECNIIDNNKNKLQHNLNIKPIVNADYSSTELDLFVITGNDLTEVKKVTEKMSRMESELQTAQAVQNTLFPEPTHYSSAKISLAGAYQPASECGGDWWFYNTIGHRVFLWIGDVTGHGVSAALVTSAARAAVSGIEANPLATPALALKILNKAIFDASKGQKFMSFCVVAIDLKTGVCSYASAAHELPFLIRGSPGNPTLNPHLSYLPSSNTSYLLGQEENAEFVEDEIILEPGDRLFLYTDGITELQNEEGEQWGDRRVRQAIVQCATENYSKQFIHCFGQILQNYKKDAELKDDMTFFIFHLINYDAAPPKLKSQHTISGTID